MRGLFDDDEEMRTFDLEGYGFEVDEGELTIFEDAQDAPATDDELDDLVGEFSYFQVRCGGCHMILSLPEANVLNLNLVQGYAEFRCPSCNEFQTSDLLVID